jgi:putative alpha-1,2-mannosidase
MVDMMGGDAVFSDRLDQLFTVSSTLSGRHQPDITGMIGQYAHGNEPSHNFAYLYNYVGRAFKTQERVRQIMDYLYTSSRDGLCGNENCGQMSSWYVFSAMGFYPVTPGQDVYAIGTPIFDEVTIYLENGQTFTINSPGTSSEKKYIQSAMLNGNAYSKSFISHGDIVKGGELTFEMSSTPNIEWGFNLKDRPLTSVSITAVMNPTISAPSGAFLKDMTITMDCGTPGAAIYYTLDGTTPSPTARRYRQPIQLTRSTTVKAIAMKDGYLPSYIESVNYNKLPNNISIR